MGQQESVPAKEQVDSTPDVGLATSDSIRNEASDDNDEGPITTTDTDRSLRPIKKEPPDEQHGRPQLASVPQSSINLDKGELVRRRMEGLPPGNHQPIDYGLLPKLDDKERPEGMTDEEWEINRTICTNPLETMDLSLLTHYGLPFVSAIPTNADFSSDDDETEEEETNEETLAGLSNDPPQDNLPSAPTSIAGASIGENQGVKQMPKKNPFKEALEGVRRRMQQEEDERKRREAEEKEKEEEERRLREEEERREEEKREREEEERRRREDEQKRARKEEEEKKRKEEEEKEIRRVEEERKKNEEEKIRNEERWREAARAELSSLEQDDALSTKSDSTSNCASEGSAGLSTKQIAQRERRRREQEKADKETARKLQEEENRKAEEEKLRKRRADTAAREAQEKREEEERKEMRKRKKEEKEKQEQKKIEEEEKKRKEEEEAKKKREEEEEKKKKEEKKKTKEDGNKSRAPMLESDSDSPIKKKQKLQKKRRSTIESSSDEESEDVPSSSAAPISHRSSTSSSTPLPPSSSTARPGASSSSGARGVGSTPLPPPSLPKTSHPTEKKKKEQVNYAGKDARVSVNQLPKIPKKTALPPPPPFPMMHPVAVPPTARSTPIGEQRKRVAMAATAAQAEKERAAAAAIAARRTSDGAERKSTVKQPRSKLKPPPVSLEESATEDRVGGIMDLMASNDAPADDVPPPPEKRVRMEMGGGGGGASTSMDGGGRPGPSSALHVRTAARVLSASSRSPSFTSPTYSSSPSNSPLYGQHPHQQQSKAPPPKNPMVFESSYPRPAHPPGRSRRKESTTSTTSSVSDSPAASEPFVTPDLPDLPISPITTAPPTIPSSAPLPHHVAHQLPSDVVAAAPQAPAAAAAAPRPAVPPAASVPKPAVTRQPSVDTPSSPAVARAGSWFPDLHSRPCSSTAETPSSPSPSVLPSSSSHSSLDPRLQSRQGGLPFDPRRKPPSLNSPLPSTSFPSRTPSIENMVDAVPPKIHQMLTKQFCAPPSSPSPNRADEWSRHPPAGPSTQPVQRREEGAPPPTRAPSNIYESQMTKKRSLDPRRCPKLPQTVPANWTRMERRVVEWEERLKRRQREKKSRGRYAMTPVEGLVWSEFKRLTSYRRAHVQEHELEYDVSGDYAICKSCDVDTRAKGRITLRDGKEDKPREIPTVYIGTHLGFEDTAAMQREQREKEEMRRGSSNARQNDDILVTLPGGSSNEDSDSAVSGQGGLTPGFDDGILPHNPIRIRRPETNEERMGRTGFIDRLKRAKIFVTTQDVVKADQQVSKEFIENEIGLEEEIDPEWEEKLAAWHASTSAASSSNHIPSGAVAGSGGSSKRATEPRGDGGGSSTNTKPSSSSSQKQSSTGVSTTPTIKVSKPDARTPSTSSSSRPSDAQKQRSREPTESPGPSTSAPSPRMTTSTSLSTPVHIPGLSPDNSTRPISRSSNEENRPSSSSGAQPTTSSSSSSSSLSDALVDANFRSVQKILLQIAGQDKQQPAPVAPPPMPPHGISPYGMIPLTMRPPTPNHQSNPQSNPQFNPHFPPPAAHMIPPPFVPGGYQPFYAHPFAQIVHQMAANPPVYPSYAAPPMPPAQHYDQFGMPSGGVPLPPAPPTGMHPGGVPTQHGPPAGMPPGVPLPRDPPAAVPPAREPSPPELPPPPPPPVLAAEEGTSGENTEREESMPVSSPEEERPSTSRGEALKKEEELPSEDYWRAPPCESGSDEDKPELKQGCGPRPEPFRRAAEWPKTTYEEEMRTIVVSKKLLSGGLTIEALKRYFEQYAEVEEIRIKRARLNIAFIRLKKHAQVSAVLHIETHELDGSRLVVMPALM